MLSRRIKYLLILILIMLVASSIRKNAIGRSLNFTRSSKTLLSLKLLAYQPTQNYAILRLNTAKRYFSSSANPAESGSLVQYKVSVAFQPKDRENLENKFVKSKKQKYAEAHKLYQGEEEGLSETGEDNYFVSIKDDSHLAMGVADGVGGWSELGFDSSAISRELCQAMSRLYAGNQMLTPKQLLSLAYQEIQQSSKVEIGGTTACLGTVNPEGLLKVANLGDSWCGVFRNYKCIEQTEFQTHGFNTPFQLAKIPDEFLKKAQRQGKKYIMDTPKSADEYEFQLQSGDFVMFATDGVTDNIDVSDMEIFLKDHAEKLLHKNEQEMHQVTSKFVTEVVKLSKDVNYPSVFAQELSRLSGQKYLGGKEDDITVLLVKVQ
ncbi:hypothetical protein BABINDRAFT_166509 [Babjeviella inositovora NRRL Y-12698]|uniref:Protein phosphatase n=1 Tax=Babjeviella inositovora NRRL Y-12698 TaxID=984486 RepID=A0A1E3QR75_9ASCO|nr:uncharacterized protein BABINDRAFT_166509 [Babjeviella inositovora NRRL Y-12698]ODQ80138.1 hypothetical protein BABINDRAFT_166509 [Babjeviella inositovora NRRL Y-12698]